MNPITSHFKLFSIPKEIAIYVTGRKFSNFSKFKIFFCKIELGNEKEMPKNRLNAKFQLNPIIFSNFQFFFFCKMEFGNEKGMPKKG